MDQAQNGLHITLMSSKLAILYPTTLFENMQVILCLFHKEDSVSLLTGYQRKGSLGRVLNDHTLLLTPQSRTFAAIFVLSRNMLTHTHKKKVAQETTSSLPLSLAAPFKLILLLLDQTIPNPLHIWYGIREKFEQDCV